MSTKNQNESTENFVYRFRSFNRALSELKNNEIFFSKMGDLNDPAEGYKDLVFNGDRILWGNFFKNYILCFYDSFVICQLEKPDFSLTSDNLPVFRNSTNYPTDIYKNKIEAIFDRFFSNDDITWLIDELSKRSDVRRDELHLYLSMIHFYIFNLVGNIKSKMDDLATPLHDLRESNIFQLVKKMQQEHKDKDNFTEVLFGVVGSVFGALREANLLSVDEENLAKRKSLILDFPDLYINALERIMFPECYSASFLKDIRNPSIWGYYGEGHQGICLKFHQRKANPNKDGNININTVVSIGSDNKGNINKRYGYRPFNFHKINYEEAFQELDFFLNIGNLSFPVLLQAWFKNEEGEISKRYFEISENEDSWRKKFWEKFHKVHTRKDVVWSHESEYRLLLDGMFEDYSSNESRKLNFAFDDLEGVIFGQKMLFTQKKTIVDLVKKKCQELGRKEFSFYDSIYSPSKGEMSYTKINI